MNQIEIKHAIGDADAKVSCKTTPKFSHSVIVRAPGLLPMLYTITELAQELVIPAPTLRDWLEQGMPQQRDERGHIWIDGRQFAQWVIELNHVRSTTKMSEGEAYCFHCRKPVKLINPVRSCQGKKVMLRGVCSECSSSICRGARIGKSD